MKFEARIFDFLRTFEAKRGCYPSRDHVKKCFPKATSAVVTACLQAASAYRPPVGRKHGGSGSRRSASGRVIPLQGNIAAGFSARRADASPPKGSLLLELADLGVILRPGTFALRVQGDSMVEAHIRHGDIVLLEPGQPRHGDIVAAMHDGSLLLKRLVLLDGVPFLKAENSAQPGMVRANDTPIHGIFRGLLRLDCYQTRRTTPHRRAITYGPTLREPSQAPRHSRPQARREVPARRGDQRRLSSD